MTLSELLARRAEIEAEHTALQLQNSEILSKIENSRVEARVQATIYRDYLDSFKVIMTDVLTPIIQPLKEKTLHFVLFDCTGIFHKDNSYVLDYQYAFQTRQEGRSVRTGHFYCSFVLPDTWLNADLDTLKQLVHSEFANPDSPIVLDFQEFLKMVPSV